MATAPKPQPEPPKKPGRKQNATAAEVAIRVADLYQLRLSGAEFADVQAFAAEKQWGVSDRQLFNYLAKADEFIAADLEPDKEKARNKHVRQRRMLFSRCMRIQDYKAALAVLKDEATLTNLYPATKLEHTGKDGGPLAVASLSAEELTDEQLAAIIAGEAAKRKPRVAGRGRRRTAKKARGKAKAR